MEEGSLYGLPDHTLPAISFRDHADDLRRFEKFAEELGVKTHNTRISRYTQYFDDLTDGKVIDERKIFKNVSDARFQSPLDWQLYLLREVHELMWILRGLKEHAPSGIEAKIEKIVSGSDFAALDKNTESRDTQFELRVASYFCQSGCTVDLSTETDIIALTDKHAFFVECKRIAGIRNLKDNLIKAKEQIICRMPKKYESRRAYGIIAADVTKLGFSHNGLTMSMTPDHARDIIQDKLKSIGEKVLALPIFSGRRDIIECLLQIHIPSVVMHPPTTSTRFSSYALRNYKVDKKSVLAINEFYKISQAGQIADKREIPSEKLEYREYIDVPEGTEFSMEREPVTSILLGTKVDDLNLESIVGSIKMNGILHEFTAMELQMVMRRFKSDKIKYFANNESERVEILLQMFAQRYPYQNSRY
ncbi:hypothetical protein C4K14_2478 [Pseudomonas chlororaphis subsp. aureofaciens]|uniref:hypothetical protein n=1 Tax=Pseudomonas chlororaphis TaxID=587753 RepID=UPI000F564DBE|nr:hypothetical protein [Pseudomonas chlororaphis]AZD85302.1 hypothetical protein C4K14_2478 [Pseudomonas chlororaphis subsp. aureofaciens]